MPTDRPLLVDDESKRTELTDAVVLDSPVQTVDGTSRVPTTPIKDVDASSNATTDPSTESLHGDQANIQNESCHQAIPRVGMTFQSEEEAYDFYNSYARSKGFSIRKCHLKRRADGTLCSRHLLCSKEGVKATHATHVTKKERATTRTCCTARVQFTISREGIWSIQKVVLDHNHGLVTPDKSYMLRSQRKLLDADRHKLNQMWTSGIRQSEIYSFYEKWYGGADNVPFLEMDSNNYIGIERKKYLESKDAQTLMDYLKSKQVEDPSFFSAVQVDEESGRLMNFFWTDGQAIMDYSVFGDVVSFDTTFSTNKFEMPFAPLLGVNHHKQTILFGAALLFDESAESFKWLFRTFLEAMSGKQPETIFTDQCAAIINAIGAVLTTTKHRLCLWHLYQNATKHLSHVISDHPEFLSEFKKCVYEDRSIAQFDDRWNELLVTYKIETNKWMNNLYKLREKWATVYRRDSFSGDMTSTQRSEGMNNVFKQTFRRKLCLSELLEAYEKCSARLRRKEKYEDFMSRHTDPVLYLPHLPLLKTAAESYTRTLFSEFEQEFKRQFNLSCTLLSSDGTTSTYKVTSFYYKDDEATVTLNPNTLEIFCSCKLYGCVGQ
uniref:Uncharacterized protein n=1 Tax=Avena sativa TaxID=4498 RepID=A0ACD5YAG3_AVESA